MSFDIEMPNVNIEVPNIYVGDTEPIDDNIEVWFNPNGESSSIEDIRAELVNINTSLDGKLDKTFTGDDVANKILFLTFARG